MSSKAKIYLYKEGNECVSLTSGWGNAFNNGSNSNILTLYDEYMQSSNPAANSWVARSTTNKFNFNKYEELTLDYELSSKTTSSLNNAMDILSNTGTWTTLNNSIVKNKMFNIQNLDVGSYTETLDISDLNSLYYANLRSSYGGVRFKNLYLTTNENTILINSQDDNSINFSCNTFDNLIAITKAEIYINNQLSKTYNDNFNNITYDIDKNLCIIGTNNIKIKVAYSQGDDIYETVEEVLTHANTVNNLPTSSSLKELIDRQELLTNTIEVQKNTLKSILESKNVEVSEEENKLSILIQKVDELSETIPPLYLYKEGVFNPLYEKVEMTEASPVDYQSTYFELKNKGVSGNDTLCRLSIKNIDFTSYTNLKIECDANVSASTSANFTINIAPKELLEPTAANAILSDASRTSFSKGIRSINVANVNGVYHLNLTIYLYSLKTYKIWLEK